MDFNSTLRSLFALNPNAAPGGLPSSGGILGGGQSQAPAAPARPDPVVDGSPAGKVLATLQARSTPQQGARGPLGIATGPLPDVKGKSKGSAFATGLSAGMNNAQNASAADAKAANDRANTNMKTMAALFAAQEQSRANDIRQSNADALKKYYEGTVANGAARANATSPKDVAANEHTIEMTKRSAATRFGLNSPQLAKDLGSPIPSIRDAAKAEYDRRKGGYDAWERSFNGRVGAGADPVDAAVGAHVKTGTDGDPAKPPVPGAPAAPAGGPAGAPATPAPATAAKPAPAAARTPETWQPIRNKADGSMWLWNPATGEKKPAGGQPTAPQAPSQSFPEPSPDAPARPAPAVDSEDDDTE